MVGSFFLCVVAKSVSVVSVPLSLCNLHFYTIIVLYTFYVYIYFILYVHTCVLRSVCLDVVRRSDDSAGSDSEDGVSQRKKKTSRDKDKLRKTKKDKSNKGSKGIYTYNVYVCTCTCTCVVHVHVHVIHTCVHIHVQCSQTSRSPQLVEF